MAKAGGFIERARAPFARQVRALNGLPKILASFSDFDVVLATTKKEIRRAQKLRFKVFFEEGGATPDPTARLIRRDVCRFDSVCDHLIVVDRSVKRINGAPTVVGAYRLLRQDVAEANFGFYSAGEFQIGALMARHPDKRFLELGRSCVARGYRGKRTLELLWRGIWTYARHYGVDAMFGCASFPGVDADVHAAALRLLRGETTAAPDWDVAAVAGRAAKAAPSEAEDIDARTARALPPLIKGYWRLGARFSRDAVVDEAFGATDVLVVLPVEEIRSRYLAYFAPAEPSSSLAA
jgi:putative hemolysin